MSLQVWLPLNGNINNQGVDFSAVITCSNPQYTTGGKLCNKYFTSSSDISVTSNVLKSSKVWSYCYWGYIKSSLVTSNWTKISHISDGGDCLRTEVCPSSYGNGIYCYSVHNNAANKITNNASSSPAGGYYDQWAHFCLTSDGATITKYMNGIKINTLPYNGTGAITGTFVFSNSNIIHKQDIRIYDHCLSPKEVKEISKGLFLHYKLGGNDGYFCGRNLILNSYKLNGQWSAAGNYVGTTTVVADADAACGYHIESKCTTAGSGPHYPVFSKSSDKIGKTYTWSFEAKCSVNKSAGTIGHECGGTRSIALTTTWTRYTHTWKFTDEKYHSFVFYPGFSVGEILYIRDFKIEENSKPSLWTPAPEDNPSLYNTTTEFDTSGFGNNGTIVGSIGTDGTSPRYDCSYLFNTNATYINTTLTTAGYSNSYTISYWAKKSNMTGCMAFGFADGNRLNVYPNNGVICWNTGDSENNPFQNNGTSVALSTYNNGNWHHYAVAGNGTTTTLYIDGEKVGTAKTYKAITGTQLYISGWNSGTDYAWVTGSISDFRMYATTLSASDVKELYNAPISITNTGVLMTQGEFKEV